MGGGWGWEREGGLPAGERRSAAAKQAPGKEARQPPAKAAVSPLCCLRVTHETQSRLPGQILFDLGHHGRRFSSLPFADLQHGWVLVKGVQPEGWWLTPPPFLFRSEAPITQQPEMTTPCWSFLSYPSGGWLNGQVPETFFSGGSNGTMKWVLNLLYFPGGFRAPKLTPQIPQSGEGSERQCRLCSLQSCFSHSVAGPQEERKPPSANLHNV